MAILLDQGKISPDDDIRRYVPEMHKFDPPVRIRHMIRCRSGIWAQWHIAQLAGWYAEPTETPYTQNDLLTLLSGQKTLPFEPGSQFSYSTCDYFLMGIIVERVTGLSLADFAKKNLFEPLGMSSTFIMEAPAQIVKRRAVGYQQTNGQWHQWAQSSAGPGGRGLYTCVDDLYRWDQNFYDNRLSSGRCFSEFITEGTLLGNRNVLDAKPPGTYRGVKRIQFTGGMPGYVSAMTQFPDQQFTVICLCNNSTIAPWQINSRIADLYLAKELEPVQKKNDSEAVRRAQDKEVELDEAKLRNKTGAFRLRADGRIWKTVFRDGQLMVIDHLNKATPLIPMGRDRFQPVGGFFHETARFEFTRTSPESPFSLTSRWNGGTVRMDRVDLVEPGSAQLTDYEGQFLSHELAATYRFRVADGKLLLRVNNLGWVPLDPTVQDQFVPGIRQNHDNRVFTFKRNQQNQVTEMFVKLWRVKGVSFAKRRNTK
ncbi:MAG TPA: class C beta-lactamase-related serine hydrolase [Fuerstia sp.]|nr:class C beta-lactamase-related serine hydrolase [Fuerstiella sp.]